MKLIIKFICIICIVVPKTIKCQTYFSMVVPVERSINIHNLVSSGNDIWVSGLMFFELAPDTIIPGSIVAKINLTSKDFEFYEFQDYIFSYGTPTFDGSNFYAYADDYNNFPTATILNLNFDYEITNIYDLENWNENSNVLYSKLHDDYLYGVSLIQDAEGAKTLLRLNKIELNDSLVWGKTFGVGDKFTTPRGLNISNEGEVYISSGVFHFNMTGPFSQLHKLDQEGNEIWRYESEEEIASITSDQYVSLLSNDQILLISRVDKRFDSQYLSNNWYPFPAKFSFLSSEGIHIRDTIFNTPNDVEPVVEGVKTSKKGDVFIFGSWEDEEKYGWLLKMNTAGEILWSRKYKHSKYKDTGHLFEIVEIHEYDNGDIIAVGTAQIIGENNEIWIIKINEHGCLDDNDCEDIVIASTEDASESVNTSIKIYPNPNLGILNWESSKQVDRIEIMNSLGEKVLELFGDEIQNEINLSQFPRGIYILKFSDLKNNYHSMPLILSN